MVARSPPKQNKKEVTAATVAALNPRLIRETLKKVDQCMVRLQELQYTVAGGRKLVSGVDLSPGSTRTYLRTSLRCKQESLRINNGVPRRSPTGKFPRANNSGEWRRMSLPAMLVGETVGEILQASQFAREIVSAVSKKPTTDDPKTPVSSSQRPSHKNNVVVNPENTELKARRKEEKQTKLQSDSPPLQRARSRINFKVSPPKARKEFDKENKNYLANRVSPRNRPWGSKTVLFPNPLFKSTTTTTEATGPSSSSTQQQFGKTKSPLISRNRGTPTQHKFLIKSPPATSASKLQVKVKSPPTILSISPTRRVATSLSKSSPKRMTASYSSSSSKWIRPFSPSRLTKKGLASPLKKSTKNNVQKSYEVLVSSNGHAISSPKRASAATTTASKLRRSFSPLRLACRLVSLSPLKSRKTTKDEITTMKFPPRRI